MTNRLNNEFVIEAFSYSKVKVSKLLNKLSGKVLFPEKLKTANKIIEKLKMN